MKKISLYKAKCVIAHFALIMCATLALPVHAQPLIQLPSSLPIDQKRLFISSKFGWTTYGGDTDNNRLGQWGTYIKDRGYLFGLEAGYRLSKRYEVSVGGVLGNYPKIEPDEYVPNANDTRRLQFVGNGKMILNPGADMQTYLTLGGNLMLGHYYRPQTLKKVFRPGIGITGGLGLAYMLNRQTALYIETNISAITPDDAADSADYGRDFGSIGNPDKGGDLTNTDILGFLGFGVRYNLSNEISCLPVRATSLNAPLRINANRAATMIGAVNEASQPIDLTWDFGDGRMGTGKVVDHRFPKPGTYTVSFSATNCGGTDTRTAQIIVEEPPIQCEKPVIRHITHKRDGWDGITVSFAPEVEGTLPMEYIWDFGDGNTSIAQFPRYTYPRAGNFKVTLQAQNCGGEDLKTEIIQIAAEVARESSCIGLDLKPIYFSQNSAVLDEEDMAALRDNVGFIQRCKSVCVQASGYFDYPEASNDLATRRALTVKSFYTQNGIPASRIIAASAGRSFFNCQNEDSSQGCLKNRKVESSTKRCN